MHPMNPEDVTLMRLFVYAAVGAFVGTFVGLWLQRRERERYKVIPLIWNGHGFSPPEESEPPADLNTWWPTDESPRQ